MYILLVSSPTLPYSPDREKAHHPVTCDPSPAMVVIKQGLEENTDQSGDTGDHAADEIDIL